MEYVFYANLQFYVGSCHGCTRKYSRAEVTTSTDWHACRAIFDVQSCSTPCRSISQTPLCTHSTNLQGAFPYTRHQVSCMRDTVNGYIQFSRKRGVFMCAVCGTVTTRNTASGKPFNPGIEL